MNGISTDVILNGLATVLACELLLIAYMSLLRPVYREFSQCIKLTLYD